MHTPKTPPLKDTESNPAKYCLSSQEKPRLSRQKPSSKYKAEESKGAGLSWAPSASEHSKETQDSREKVD